MKTLDQVDFRQVFLLGLETPVHITTSRLCDEKDLDVVFSRPISADEACTFLHRVYLQISGEYPCTRKAGNNYSIELRHQGKSAIFADHAVSALPALASLLPYSAHHKFTLVKGDGSLAQPLAFEVASS